MRKNHQKQLPLMIVSKDHPQSQELEYISEIIDENPTMSDLILQDLTKGRKSDFRKGANGMSADQVLRVAIVKTLFGFTYEELAFHIVDSQTLRWFCRIGIADKGFQKSTLNKNIKSLSDESLKKINEIIVNHAKDEGIEKGRTVRIDSTCVESNIHAPSDSSLLWDAVRVLTRLMIQCQDDHGIKIVGFQNHKRVAKRRAMSILNAKGEKQRTSSYKDLIGITGKVLEYAHTAMTAIKLRSAVNSSALGLWQEISHYSELTLKVIDQAKRRVLQGEKVPVSDKVVSIFEPHTDIIVKDRRDTYYGHKICLTGGASNLILDCMILEGNPADSELTIPMLSRQKELYGRYPLKASFDGAFASKDNLAKAKDMNVKDVCFAKKRGISESDMCRSHYVYSRLRKFRAGIESGISWLKRSLGLTRCTWKGWESFKSYVWSSIIGANLLTIARAKTKLAT